MESSKAWTRPRTIAGYGLALVAGWVAYAQAIAPLRQQAVEARRHIGALEQRTADARKAISESRAQGGSQDWKAKKPGSDFPAGPALVWLPERMQQHFGQYGFPGVVTRLNTVREEKDLPGYERSYWRVSIPIPGTGSDSAKLLRATAELDAPDSLVRVMDFAIGADPQNPARKVAAMNVSALLPK